MSLLTREQAIQGILDKHGKEAVYIFATGYIARTGFKLCWGKYTAFYMMGSMGLAPAICGGLEFSRAQFGTNIGRTICINGDGAHNMFRSGMYGPYCEYILRNDCYESTGGQSTLSSTISNVLGKKIINITSSSPDPRISIHPKEIANAFADGLSR